ncbi:MAG TPA: class I SAM-dependent methyltransferase [Hyphomicrobiaceae bacterium]|nr:class I SAM-dependent methyltransferase [Hyphomicrobiaceae bacterium]
MTLLASVVRGIALSCLVVLAGWGAALAQEAKDFQPKIGQEGKDVIWVPTPEPLVEKMLDMAKLTPQDYLVDLGSGDGRTVIAAAKRGARALGIEYNPDMVELSKRNAARAGVSERASFVKADIFESDFSDATVVTLFLLPSLNVKLRPKLLEMKPGTRVVSNSFDMGDWSADETAERVEGCTSFCRALLWIVPAKVAGTWSSPQGELQLEQTFQMVTGRLRSTPVSDGRLVGDRLTFRAGEARYSGQVSDNVIEGTMSAGGNETAWRATRVAK